MNSTQELDPQIPTRATDPQAEAEKQTDWEDQYKRLAAELENTKKQLERRYWRQFDQKQVSIFRSLLPTIDNLERVLALRTPDEQCISLYQGIELTLKEFKATLAKLGVETVQAMGEFFDPDLHEVVGSVERKGIPSGQIVEVHQTGYRQNDRLLRPARVVIAT
jgi:molecular chaperone GrpE